MLFFHRFSVRIKLRTSVFSRQMLPEKKQRAFEILDFSMRIYLAHLLTDWLRQRFPQKKQQGRLRVLTEPSWGHERKMRRQIQVLIHRKG